MSFDDPKAKKELRITNLVIEIAIASVSIVFAYALWLTIDFSLYIYDSYTPMFSTISGLQGLLIGITIVQGAGVISIIFRAASRIIRALLKEGGP